MNISCIIMASGHSKRMGKNKLFLEFNNKKIFEYTLDLVKEVDFKEVILVSSYDEILRYGENLGFKGVKNLNSEIGKSSSIHLGVNKVSENLPMMFFVCDQPLLSLDTVNKLIKAYNKNNLITYPVINNRRGAPVIFPPEMKEELLSLKNDQGGMLLVKDKNRNEVPIENEEDLVDIDTEEDYENLKENHEK